MWTELVVKKRNSLVRDRFRKKDGRMLSFVKVSSKTRWHVPLRMNNSQRIRSMGLSLRTVHYRIWRRRTAVSIPASIVICIIIISSSSSSSISVRIRSNLIDLSRLSATRRTWTGHKLLRESSLQVNHIPDITCMVLRSMARCTDTWIHCNSLL